MLFKETFPVYTDNYRIRINIKAALLIVKVGGTYSYCSSLNSCEEKE
jgi:hypothetical protein